MALLGYKCAGVRDPNEGALRTYMQEKYARTFPEFRGIRVTPNLYTTLDEVDRFSELVLHAMKVGIA